MIFGLVGSPNKGKSTFFSAATHTGAEIADYPFTTIKPNMGVSYIARPCPEVELGVKCKPRNSLCRNGIRQIPVKIVDVAGLVPGAHLGKGMGNQFLNDLVEADLLIQVVDLSGQTDLAGNPASGFDPSEEVKMVKEELASWISEIISRHINKISKRDDGVRALTEVLSGFKPTENQVSTAAERCSLPTYRITWDADAIKAFSRRFLELNKPIIVAANKLDKSKPGALAELKKKLAGITVIGCSAAVELAIRKAEQSGVIEYNANLASDPIKILKEVSQEQKIAIEYMSRYVSEHGGTGVHEILDMAAFGVLHEIAVYPVEDENKFTDHFGNVLPDVFLMPSGATALELAGKIHTDIAANMLYAIDAKKKIRLQKNYMLKDNDVIKIVSAGKKG